MKRFRYKAKDRAGKDYKGIVEANEIRSAIKVLREKGLIVYRLAEDKSFWPFGRLGLGKGVKFGELVIFTRQLSTMVNAGLQLTEAMSLLKIQVSAKFGEVIGDLQTSVEGGSSLADAMGKHPEVFSKVYVSLIRSGEAGGVLDEVLLKLAENLENEQEFRAKVKGAMIYPVIVLSGMAVVMVIMMIFVIPKMTALYSDFGADLPTATKILIVISDITSRFWFLVILAGVGAVYLLRVVGSTREGKKRLHALRLRLPVVGNLSKMLILADFTRTTSLLVSAGVSIVESLNTVAEAMGNVLYEDAVKSASRQVEKGFPLAYSLAETELFPPIVTQMVSVGEETGKVGEVLGKLAKYFENESDHLVKNLTTAIEPLIVILLGLGVAFLLVAIILPIYNLTTQIKG